MKIKAAGRVPVRVIAAVLAAPLFLAACTGGTGATPGKTVAPGQTITYWSHLKEGEALQVVMAKAIADFEKESGHKVQVEWQGRQVVQKVVPTLNTNNVPDLVDSGFGKLAPVIAETGQAAPMGDLYNLTVDGKKVSEIIPAQYLSDSMKVNGQFWMMPYLVTGDALWFNKQTHPELSSNAPKTWSEFVSLLGQLKAAGKTPVAMDGDISGYNSWWFTTLYLRDNGVGSFFKLASDKTGASWESAEAKAAAAAVEELVKGGYVIDGFAASKWPAQQQAWATGKAELLFNGTWIPAETSTYASQGFVFDSMQLPPMTAGKDKIARADLTGFAIPAKADGKEVAGQLSVYLLRKSIQQSIATDAKQVPLRADVDVVESMASAAKAIRESKAVYQQNDGVAFPGWIEKVYYPIGDQFITGKISSSEFLTKMKDAQAKYWKEQG